MWTTSARLVAALALVLLVACGGDDVGTQTGSAPSSEPDAVVVEDAGPTLAEFGGAVVTAVGAERALAAVLYALDAGYSLEQLVPAAFDGDLGATGTITGADPVRPAYGLITPPPEPAGLVRRGLTGHAIAGETYDPDEVQAAINAKLTTLQTINLLGTPLGVGGEIGYDEVFGVTESAPTSPADEATVDEATAVIGVLVGLVDLGYSFDQALEGWLFGEVEFAIGVDPTGETFTGVSLGDRPVAVCFTLRGSSGQVVPPAGEAPATMFGSATCARAISNGTITYDGLDALRVEAAERTPDSSDAADASTPADADVSVFDGIYTTDEIERDSSGAIRDVVETIVEVSVMGGVVDGAVIQTDIVVNTVTIGTETYTKTEQVTQTVQLLGEVDPAGALVGEGTTSTEYALLGCEPEEPCRGVGPTRSAGGTAVSLSGTIDGDTMHVETVNSVSGATVSFSATR